MQETKKIKNRKFIISTLIIIALLSLSTVIVFQYRKYNQIEDRLNQAYSNTNFQSLTFYKLFSTYSEADNLFDLYTINFDPKDYLAYNEKLDTIKFVIDSLANLPSIKGTTDDSKIIDDEIVSEYINLKKQVDHLILFSKDSISQKIDTKSLKTKQNIVKTPIKVIDNIVNDSSLSTVKKDTIVKKKGSLFNRIFKSKNDTIISHNNIEVQKNDQIQILVQKNVEQIISHNNAVNENNLKLLRNRFESLKKAEKELLIANRELLNKLKKTIEQLRSLEFKKYKNNQEADFLIYTKNTTTIKIQLIFLLSLMVVMVVLVLSYQKQVYFYDRKLINERDYAAQIAEEKTSVLANISHEIRTPLNSLRGLVSLLKNNSSSELVDKELISSIDYDIAIINTVVNDILSLSKLESGTMQITNEQINIHNLIEDLVALHLFQATSKGLQLINNNKISKSVLIDSNPFRIKQVISNLITNAIKYTNKGTITITSEIVNNNSLMISVADTGIGIIEEQVEQIFRKYYIADASNKAGGFGLGLYISKILAEQINGKLSLRSILGQGTTFTFDLTLKEIKESLIENHIKQTINLVSENLNIVFIDDSKINLFFVKQLFNDRKNVHYFMDPAKALDHIDTIQTDIVITDLKMPSMTGWDILNHIKSKPELQHIKVFVSTAEPLLLEENSGPYLFDGTISKPMKESELVSKLTNS